MTIPSDAGHPAAAEAEASLVRRAQDGNLDAFNELVDMHQRAVFNLCLRMIGSHAAAEDGAQEAFIAAYRNLRSFRGGSFRAWLMRIASNACTDELRRRARRPALSLDQALPGSDEGLDVPDPTAGPETEALRSEQQAVVQAALLTLPDDQRLAVVLCDIEGFSYEEIAEAMRCSLGTVKSRIARGRDKLRSALLQMEQMGEGERL
jgi:RNA polymerase sigma-70 factor (ECF subfamily)